MDKKRKLVTAERKIVVSGAMKEAAAQFYIENKLANEHGTKAKNLRTGLMASMMDAGVKAFTATYVGVSGSVALDVEIAAGRNSSTVDMKNLRKLVADDEKLLSLCSMTKTDIVTHFGTAMADQVCKTKAGKEDVQVKAAK